MVRYFFEFIFPALLIISFFQLTINFFFGYFINKKYLKEYRFWSGLIYFLISISFPIVGILKALLIMKEYGAPDAIAYTIDRSILISWISFIVGMNLTQWTFNRYFLEWINSKRTK